ncbi:1,4-dihydroxy-2-naphthoyl-CoA hydrolase [Anatilimnocola aggregata]|uniref:1,4-dihydroxy-2-naphthoyl-CoA hydrolase n=1 Tax=Anatilimnocola aggregata TaxID=2528021 RepID=A0A517YLS5_9BACT|nr:thioesterase family protein [Anatilimnocola aggregata]QDU31179.1 1,4-dihydroxy-2-naphthoyl-CoA hydrolase [Anatilimnocola aggregata]
MTEGSPVPFRHARRVAFSETDLTGCLHFANLLRYFEEAEQALFRSLGIPMLWRRDDGVEQGWPRVSAACDLLLPIQLADELQIEVAIERLRPSSVMLQFTVFRREELVARGRLRLACIAARPGQPMRAAPIPEDMQQKFRALMA